MYDSLTLVIALSKRYRKVNRSPGKIKSPKPSLEQAGGRVGASYRYLR